MKTFERMNKIATVIKPKLLARMMLVSFFTATVLSSQLVGAAVYKKVDADGNVSFSDVPDKAAKLISVPPLATVPAMSPELIASTLETDPQAAVASRAENYTLTILSPTADQTYRRAADAFSANVQVKPDLKNGDRLVLLVDGKPVTDHGSTEEMERGQHQFLAKIVNASGRVLMSKSVSFNVLQSNVKQQAPIGKPPVGKKP